MPHSKDVSEFGMVGRLLEGQADRIQETEDVHNCSSPRGVQDAMLLKGT